MYGYMALVKVYINDGCNRYVGINPYIIVELPTYVHAYMFDEVAQEVCHVSGYEK